MAHLVGCLPLTPTLPPPLAPSLDALPSSSVNPCVSSNPCFSSLSVNATCAFNGTTATCTCPAGFSGDGKADCTQGVLHGRASCIEKPPCIFLMLFCIALICFRSPGLNPVRNPRLHALSEPLRRPQWRLPRGGHLHV